MEFLEFVLPGQKRSKLVYWATIIDTALLFAAQNNTHDSESDDVNSENNDEDLDNDQSCLKHSEFRVPFLHLMSEQSSCY